MVSGQFPRVGTFQKVSGVKEEPLGVREFSGCLEGILQQQKYVGGLLRVGRM